jgi:hypothetical protein
MPAHDERAGSIILAQAYAASKMLDNSRWNGILRNKITPSDVDHPSVGLCFDNNGAVLFCDFSISCADWSQHGRFLKGQRWLYESIIKGSRHAAILCKHDVRGELCRQIDTLADVQSFQVMVWDFGPVLSPVWAGKWWQRFVTRWVNDPGGPLMLRRHVLGLSVGLS